MTKQEIAKQMGYSLCDGEIDVICYIWTNMPKTDVLRTNDTYVDLSRVTDESCNPFRRVLIAHDLVRKGLLEEDNQMPNKFKLSKTGEALHAAFYQ